jgi:hypothetical protein
MRGLIENRPGFAGVIAWPELITPAPMRRPEFVSLSGASHIHAARLSACGAVTDALLIRRKRDE